MANVLENQASETSPQELTADQLLELQHYERVNKSRYACLKNDMAFKTVFSHKEVLLGLLNALIDDYDITDVEFISREELSDLVFGPQELHNPITSKRSTLDLACETAQGTTIIIEMQNKYQDRFATRAMYYLSLEMWRQLKIGKDYDVKPIYSINFLNFDYTGEKGYINHFGVKNKKTNELLPGSPENYIYIELPKFTLKEDECKTKLEKIVYTIKHSEDMEFIPKSFKNDEYFENLFNFADVFNWPQFKKYEYYKRMMTERDIESIRISAVRQGLAEGRAEGRANGLAEGRAEGLAAGRAEGLAEGLAEGRAEGFAEGKLETARKLLAAGVLIDIIASCTGLAEAEVLALQQN